jgi:hypothetical protein
MVLCAGPAPAGLARAVLFSSLPHVASRELWRTWDLKHFSLPPLFGRRSRRVPVSVHAAPATGAASDNSSSRSGSASPTAPCAAMMPREPLRWPTARSGGSALTGVTFWRQLAGSRTSHLGARRHVDKAHAFEVAPAEVSRFQIAAVQLCSLQPGSREVGIAELGIDQSASVELQATKVHPGQVELRSIREWLTGVRLRSRRARTPTAAWTTARGSASTSPRSKPRWPSGRTT